MSFPSWNRRSRGPDPRRALLAIAALGALVGSSAYAAAALAPAAGPYSSASAGDLQVSLPTAYPDVQLNELGNRTPLSSLSIDQVLEATPGASPQIVAVALPSNVVVENATGPAASAGLLFTLSATLTVYPSSAGLWQGPGDLVQPDGAPVGTAALSIRYALSDPTDSNSSVTTQWSVSDWPWASASDLLGVQLSLSTPDGRALTACTGAATTVDRSGCPGLELNATDRVWGADLAGLQGALSGGPTVLVRWDPQFGTPAGPTPAVSAGAISTAPSLGHLLVAAPANGAARVGGNFSLALLPVGPALGAPLLVHGDSPWYLASLGASIAAGLAGVLAYRRRGRRIADEL